MNAAAVMLFVVLIAAMTAGIPIIWSLALASAVSIALNPALSFVIIPQRLFAGADSFSLLAVPAFILAGDIMTKGGLSKRLTTFADALVGWISGGISLVAIVACAFFAAISGSSVATTAAIGGLMHKEMVRREYPEDYSAAVQAIGGTLGIVIPPSIVFVIYGNVTGVSIAKLLMSGIVPGVIACLALCAYAYYMAKKHRFPRGEGFSWKKLGLAAKDAIWALLMPVIILGGIYSSVFTPTESAVVSVFYGTLVCFFVYREITPADFWAILKSTGKTTANLMLLVATAQVFAYLVTYYNIPSAITDWFMSFVDNKYIFLLIVNFLLILAGMFLDNGSIILIMGPILAPIAAAFGVDPVHFGLIVVFILALGQCTPPFGTCMFVACGIAGRPVSRVARYLIPFILVEIACGLLYTYVPWISLWLPNVLG
ncbi:MAG: TRAP transporter large permease [Synergistaceae bacterium]|jgi:C4-dicarboxylate transporter DctM subunit|nr:TRAP transporter large permease [Synergistaceae bacterium]